VRNRWPGHLIFFTHSFAAHRRLELWWNGENVIEKKITQTPVKIRIPVVIPEGESQLRYIA